MIQITEEEIQFTYDLICHFHEKHLKKYGVKLSNVIKLMA